jgi:hypothetical protein
MNTPPSNPPRAKKQTKIGKPKAYVAPEQQQQVEERGWQQGYDPYGGYSYGSGQNCSGQLSGYSTAAQILSGNTSSSSSSSTDCGCDDTDTPTITSAHKAYSSVWLGPATGTTAVSVASSAASSPVYQVLTAWSTAGAPSLSIGQVSATGSTTGYYVVPYTMQFLVRAQATFPASNANNAGMRSIQIVLVRGTSSYVIGQDTIQPSANNAIDTVVKADAVGGFIVGDQIYVQVAQTSGAAQSLSMSTAGTQFCVLPRDDYGK